MTGQLSWAIDTNSTEGHGYIGRYYKCSYEEKAPGGVLRVRLFETRAEARKALKDMKTQAYVAFPRAGVRRVAVRIEEVP